MQIKEETSPPDSAFKFDVIHIQNYSKNISKKDCGIIQEKAKKLALDCWAGDTGYYDWIIRKFGTIKKNTQTIFYVYDKVKKTPFKFKKEYCIGIIVKNKRKFAATGDGGIKVPLNCKDISTWTSGNELLQLRLIVNNIDCIELFKEKKVRKITVCQCNVKLIVPFFLVNMSTFFKDSYFVVNAYKTKKNYKFCEQLGMLEVPLRLGASTPVSVTLDLADSHVLIQFPVDSEYINLGKRSIDCVKNLVMYPAIEEFFLENEAFFNTDTTRFLRNTSQMYLTATKNTGFLYIVYSDYLLDRLSVKKPADFNVDYEVFANSPNSKFNDVNDLVNQMYNYKEKIEIQTQPSFFIVEKSSEENSISKMYKPLLGSWENLKKFNTAIAEKLKKIYKNIWKALHTTATGEAKAAPPLSPPAATATVISNAPPLSPSPATPPSPPVSVAKFFELAEKSSTAPTPASASVTSLRSSPSLVALQTHLPVAPVAASSAASSAASVAAAVTTASTTASTTALPASPPSLASIATSVPALAATQPETPIVTTEDLINIFLNSELVISAKALKGEIETLIRNHASEIENYDNDKNVKTITENYENNNTTKNNSLKTAATDKTKKIIKVIETAVQITDKQKELTKKIEEINTKAITDNIQNTDKLKSLSTDLRINTDNIVNETKTKKENFENLNSNVFNKCQKKCKDLIANNSFNSVLYTNNTNVKKFNEIIQALALAVSRKKK